MATWQEVIAQWMSTDYPRNPLLVVNDHNDAILTATVRGAAARGVQPTLENLKEIVRGLTEKGLLQYVANVQPAPSPLDPRTTVPHQDGPFKGINNVEKCVKYARTYRISQKDSVAFNEILAYVKLHNIHGEAILPETDARLIGSQNPDDNGDAIRGRTRAEGPVNHEGEMGDLGKDSPFRTNIQSTHKGTTQTSLGRTDKVQLTAQDLSTPLGQATALLDSLRPQDVGSFGATTRVEKLVRFRNRLIKEIGVLKAKNTPDEKILAYVQKQVSELQSCSIR